LSIIKGAYFGSMQSINNKNQHLKTGTLQTHFVLRAQNTW